MEKKSQYMQEVGEIVGTLHELKQRRAKIDDPIGRLAYVLTHEIVNAIAELAKFNEKVLATPSRAFEWADAAVQAAATLDICAGLGFRLAPTNPKEGVTDEERFAKVRIFAISELQRRGGFVNQSTSVMSNLVARYELAAYAKLFDSFSGALALA